MSAHTWHADLASLGTTLRDEAITAQGNWAWRLLRGGALVACRLDPATGRRTFRIARDVAPAFEQRAAWARELATFAKRLSLEGWPVTHHATDAGGVEALYVEPEPTLFQQGDA